MIDIRFVKVDFTKILFALEKVRAQALLQRDDMQYYCSVEFHHLLIKNLNHETFAGGFSQGGVSFPPYAPYTTRYAAWKHSSGNFWKLEGDLIRNIVRRKFGRGGFAVGVNDVKDAGGKSWLGKGDKGKPKSIGMYATVAEFGKKPGPGGKHPGRPLFRPTREEFANDIWLKEGEKALTKIGYSWS